MGSDGGGDGADRNANASSIAKAKANANANANALADESADSFRSLSPGIAAAHDEGQRMAKAGKPVPVSPGRALLLQRALAPPAPGGINIKRFDSATYFGQATDGRPRVYQLSPPHA